MILFLIPLTFLALLYWSFKAKNKKIPLIVLATLVFIGTFSSPFVLFGQRSDDQTIHTKFTNRELHKSIDSVFKSSNNEPSTKSLKEMKESADRRTQDAITNGDIE